MIRGNIFIVKNAGGGFRGQSGIEMIVSIGMIMIIFMVVLVIVIEKTQESADIKTLLDARRLSDSMKDNVNMIAQEGPGYYSYFSLPEQLSGGYDYDLVISGNVLELMWPQQTWTTKLAASNITVYCLSKGLSSKNRIYYGDDGIEITCDLPNLKVVRSRFFLDRANNRTAATVVNDAQAGAPAFLAVFKTNNTQINEAVGALGPYEEAVLEFNASLAEYAGLYLDPAGVVNESIRRDNNFTVIL
jgi:hypothetical protein